MKPVGAGENGKGFNVVPNEVKKLADNSAQSVKQVGLVIKDIQQANEQVAAYSQQLCHRQRTVIQSAAGNGCGNRKVKLHCQ
ncbi:hypothetical protein DESHY_30056 [Desulforamulus hydrothermalis Lam5 = DSM 18033]|uniref:Methyl-accepting transducer domain-containing protein n=1 Tax=Desulforamulus hydrothermalis Lam5 = DSM 18033 TaxID=1121428 RepID=K8EID4_9FIRM|nr:hypothetical protein DESHY_30056 [Desulforamulus hydrothermalis Lam5 = DSM 18033]